MKTSLSNQIRQFAFWAKDAIKGGEIKSNLQDIEESFALESFQALEKKNDKYLHGLLKKATSKTKFYAHLKGQESLHNFPVVDKNVIRANFDDLQMDTSSHTVFTSGSTGTPFMVHQTQKKKSRNTADTLYFAGRAGYVLGDKLLYLRLWSKKLKKKRFLATLQNIVQLDIENLEEQQIKDLLKGLQKDNSKKGWLGYPSGLEKICDYLDSTNSGPLDCNIGSIIGISENLSGHVKSKMGHYFGVPMVSRYSNTENGILAQQPMGSDYFTINWASYIVEILDFNEDSPVKNGELGRIVITDLFNEATPMIRYDTGDVGSMSIKPEHPFPVLNTVEGRQSDILFDTKGALVSPFKIMSIVLDFPEVRQLQVIQTDISKYTVKVNNDGKFDRETELSSILRSYVGNDAHITVDYVDEIPSLSSKKQKISRNLLVEKSKPSKENMMTV
ncbi:phenylacetate--CoA ligase family protein [Flagellimonas amoyensis]|uniref:phenylacetate--CoA ligase family protein n=1 Tax=Flagellimonas amoyensis TaxID=2169401 RepID=UPI000D35B0BA|nr:phenylacetate--CoA ligase family protein [Allomuricauda amoyensis]